MKTLFITAIIIAVIVFIAKNCFDDDDNDQFWYDGQI